MQEYQNDIISKLTPYQFSSPLNLKYYSLAVKSLCVYHEQTDSLHHYNGMHFTSVGIQGKQCYNYTISNH